MTKADLVGKIAEKTGLTKANAERALNAFIEAVEETLVGEGKITLTGFGTFMHELAKQYFQHLLAGEEGAKARHYLERRQVNAGMIEQFGLGVSPVGWHDRGSGGQNHPQPHRRIRRGRTRYPQASR